MDSNSRWRRDKKYGNDYELSTSLPIVLPNSLDKLEKILTKLSRYKGYKVSLLKIIKDKNYWKDEYSDVSGSNYSQLSN